MAVGDKPIDKHTRKTTDTINDGEKPLVAITQITKLSGHIDFLVFHNATHCQ